MERRTFLPTQALQQLPHRVPRTVVTAEDAETVADAATVVAVAVETAGTAEMLLPQLSNSGIIPIFAPVPPKRGNGFFVR